MNESNALYTVGTVVLVIKGVKRNNPVIRVRTIRNGMPCAKMESILVNHPPSRRSNMDQKSWSISEVKMIIRPMIHGSNMMATTITPMSLGTKVRV